MSEEKDIEKTSQGNGPSTSSGQMQVPIEKGDTLLVCNAPGTAIGSKVYPQPTTDPLDPLNWSSMQKHVVLAIVMFKLVLSVPLMSCSTYSPINWQQSLTKYANTSNIYLRYFLFTYLTTTTVPSFTEIQNQYQITYSQVNWTVAVPALGLSVGPLIWSSLSDIYGRRLIFLIGTTIALVSTIGAAVADSYSGYMAARFFQGFGVSPASTVGMAVGKSSCYPIDICLLNIF